MATYAELNAILTESVTGAQELREKVRVACLVAAQTIASGGDTGGPWSPTGHDQRLKWMVKMLSAPDATSREMFGVAVAANAAVSQAGILGASDSMLQTNVNASIDALAANLV